MLEVHVSEPQPMPGKRCPFPRYHDYDPAVPVYCMTPEERGVIHRFFDSSPISPSGRYLAVTRIPCEDRSPEPGEAADVIVVDVHAGTSRAVATTLGWDTQLGAQVQWGATDDDLYFNDLEAGSWTPFGVHLNSDTRRCRRLGGTIYHVSPNAAQAVSPCLLRTSRTQRGYGVLVPDSRVPCNRGAPDDDGIYITDLRTGEARLLVSLRTVVEACPALQDARYSGGDFYAFHSKWNHQGDRILFIVRWLPGRHRFRRLSAALQQRLLGRRSMLRHVVTMAADGSDVQLAVDAGQWARGGHHPNWSPDGRHVTMNLNAAGDGLRFVEFRCDGRGMQVLHDDIPGSGHPSMHPGGRFLVTDAYPHEPVAFGDGTVPIRLIDLQNGVERCLVRIRVQPAHLGAQGEMRVDAHPTWDPSGKLVIFNAYANGTRQVFAADVSGIVDS